MDFDGCSGFQCRSEVSIYPSCSDICSICRHELKFLVSFCVHSSVCEYRTNSEQIIRKQQIIAVATSVLIGIFFTAVVLIFRKQLAELFTDVPELIRETSKLGYLLGATILLNSIQPVLSGVSIGAGWQALVAFVNTACYYLFGLPIGAVLGFKLELNELGIWTGMLIGTAAQTGVLLLITVRTKWQKEILRCHCAGHAGRRASEDMGRRTN
ncbi:hypothetical protein C4D60_Mb05t01790 [Musa balbisiana]|uniref:Protein DETOXIFICATION n=1 Tax=Musa balbisiana TaxID=52838 RepID=A0A4S8JT07_MUSBA|nr:hypothetical protein C4D60_Mb05t01790 [Musa balbisiana]